MSSNLKDKGILFETVFKNSAVGFALVAPDGKWLQVNKSLCKIVGYTEKELLGKTFQDITHKDDLEKDLGNVKQMLDGTIKTYQMEKRYIHKDGHTVWVLLNVSLIRGDENKPEFFISEIQNITKQKEYEEELKEKISELEKMNKAMITRELTMAEMKEKAKAVTEKNSTENKTEIKELTIN